MRTLKELLSLAEGVRPLLGAQRGHAVVAPLAAVGAGSREGNDSSGVGQVLLGVADVVGLSPTEFAPALPVKATQVRRILTGRPRTTSNLKKRMAKITDKKTRRMRRIRVVLRSPLRLLRRRLNLPGGLGQVGVTRFAPMNTRSSIKMRTS